ncbi:MAG: orotate phosphoribosyltransferase [Elusimicrobia bacterium]|nr:orotate phosphoribosyltransferase [Elusimicrobiota bacterium]
MSQAADPQRVRAAFEANGALLSGHFLLSSGLHSQRYLQCALVLSDPPTASWLGAELAAAVRTAGISANVVVSPALGGLFIGQEVARALGLRHLFSERDNGVMTLRRGFSIAAGSRALIVEDVVTTGKSSSEVVQLVRGHGGIVAGLASIVDRGAPDLGLPQLSLLRLEIPAFKPEDCPLCKQGLPFVKPGSRKHKP